MTNNSIGESHGSFGVRASRYSRALLQSDTPNDAQRTVDLNLPNQPTLLSDDLRDARESDSTDIERDYERVSGLMPLDVSLPSGVIFAATDARHDRLKIRVSAAVIIPSGHDIIDVISEIYAPMDDSGIPSILRLTRERAQNRWKVDLLPPARWLFNISGRAYWSTGDRLLRFDLVLDLNPTRWLAHQSSERRRALIEGEPCECVPLETLRQNNDVARAISAMTLDHNDNMLPAPIEAPEDPDERTAWWQRVLSHYLVELHEILHIMLVPRLYDAEMHSLRYNNISQAEVYAELHCENAIAWISQCRRMLCDTDAATRATIYQDNPSDNLGIQVERMHNAECVRLPLTRDIGLKIYAKSANRVRFEVSFTKRISQVAARAGVPSSADIVVKLMGLRIAASQRLQQTWRPLMQRAQADDGSTGIVADIIDLFDSFNAIVEEPHQRTLMTSLLATGGVVETTPGSEGQASIAPRRVCRELERRGIVSRSQVRRRGPRFYALNARYRRLFDTLQSATTSLPLDADQGANPNGQAHQRG